MRVTNCLCARSDLQSEGQRWLNGDSLSAMPVQEKPLLSRYRAAAFPVIGDPAFSADARRIVVLMVPNSRGRNR